MNKETGSNVPLVSVISGDIFEYAEAIGYIKPHHQSIIKSQVDGIVAEIYHREGEYVTKGTPLIRIDPAPSPEIYAGTYQELADAKAREKSSLSDVRRFQKALKEGLINTNYTEYITAQENYDTAKASRILAEQKLALIEKGNTIVAGKPIANVVVSPIDGYILNRNVDIGDPILSISSAQASTIIFSIADMQDLMFEGLVDEIDAAKVKVGMLARIYVGSLPDIYITGTLDKISLQSEMGNIAAGGVSATGDNSPFNVGFDVQVTNLKVPSNVALRSGYSATAKIKTGFAHNVLILPARVVQFKDSETYVLVPAISSKNAEPIHVPIVIGLSDGVDIEIKKGLKLGDKVLDKQEVKIPEAE
jgi:HlyD family secretion protein